MARYTGSVCRQCRREACKLFLKGDKCYTEKCPVTKRHTPPGQHGQGRKKQSEYGIQLREKQKVRRAYGILESQFHKYYEIASNMRGVTGENMLSLIERRLDNVAYRLNFGESRPMARQMVNHGHIRVNGRKVDIASYQVKVGDVISVKETSRDVPFFVTLKEQGEKRSVPAWLELDCETLSGTVKALPSREDIDLSISEHLIVEFYSR